jgi:Tol biopolymer transport system component
VFLHDRQTGETKRVSVDSGGNQGNDVSGYPAISPDGRYVAFGSDASNLVSGDTNGVTDVFVHDCETGETTRVSVSSDGAEGNADSGYFGYPTAISDGGRFVAFASAATNLVSDDTNPSSDVFVHDRQTGMTTLVSRDSHGTVGNNWSGHPCISGDGRLVAFVSSANNLIPDDTNGEDDIFVHDCQTGETERASVDWQGGQSSLWSNYPCLSSDGRFVGFMCGAALVPDDTNGMNDVYLRDLVSRETIRVSVDFQGGQVEGAYSAVPASSADGRVVAFESISPDLVPGDSNGLIDIFVRDRAPCSQPASWTNYGTGWAGTKGIPEIMAGSNPLLCATIDVLADNSAGADALGVLFMGFASTTIPTAWGGALLVRPVLCSNVLVPASGFVVNAQIPCDGSLCSFGLFVQLVQRDVGASRGLSFTPGLELRLGVQ